MPYGKRKGTGHAFAKREMGECTSEMKGTRYSGLRKGVCALGKGMKLGTQLLKRKSVSAQVKGTRYSLLRKGVSAMGKGKGDRNAVSPQLAG